MQTTTFTSTRLTLTKQERLISKSWGSWWNYFGRMERTHGCFNVLFGDWSGYTSSQSRITHVDWCPKSLDERYHGTVRFTDNTTMKVWVEKLTRKDIIRRGLRRNPSYESLIHKLLSSGSNYYDVAKQN
jgi:hypothetical protein